MKKLGRPKTNYKAIHKTSELGTKAGETRATFIINQTQLGHLKALAFWERTSIKDVLSQALNSYLTTRKRDLFEAVELLKKLEDL